MFLKYKYFKSDNEKFNHEIAHIVRIMESSMNCEAKISHKSIEFYDDNRLAFCIWIDGEVLRIGFNDKYYLALHGIKGLVLNMEQLSKVKDSK